MRRYQGAFFLEELFGGGKNGRRKLTRRQEREDWRQHGLQRAKDQANWGGWDADQSLGITGMELRQLQRSLATVRVAAEGMSRGILSARRTGVQEMGAS